MTMLLRTLGALCAFFLVCLLGCRIVLWADTCAPAGVLRTAVWIYSIVVLAGMLLILSLHLLHGIDNGLVNKNIR